MVRLFVREYGRGANTVIALHGGPAAAGDVAPLARELGRRWRVLEPHQRSSGSSGLSVETHVCDLHEVIREKCDGHALLVGHSWGAMLALAYAARYPKSVAGIALIGCGTFSSAARAEFARRLEARLTDRDRAEAIKIQTESDVNRWFAKHARLVTRVYGHDIREPAESLEFVDAAAHRQTWGDMMRLQREGVYPPAFASIEAPVLMLHGKEDPHPGRLTAEDLSAHIPHLEYVEFEKCGHSPWLEQQASKAFFEELNKWIEAKFRASDV